MKPFELLQHPKRVKRLTHWPKPMQHWSCFRFGLFCLSSQVTRSPLKTAFLFPKAGDKRCGALSFDQCFRASGCGVQVTPPTPDRKLVGGSHTQREHAGVQIRVRGCIVPLPLRVALVHHAGLLHVLPGTYYLLLLILLELHAMFVLVMSSTWFTCELQ